MTLTYQIQFNYKPKIAIGEVSDYYFPKKLVKIHLKNNLFCLDFAQTVLNDGPSPRQGKKSDQAHPPIHPTKYTNGLEGQLKKF